MPPIMNARTDTVNFSFQMFKKCQQGNDCHCHFHCEELVIYN